MSFMLCPLLPERGRNAPGNGGIIPRTGKSDNSRVSCSVLFFFLYDLHNIPFFHGPRRNQVAEHNAAEEQSRRQQAFGDSAGERIFLFFRRKLTQRRYGEYCTEGELPEPLYLDFYMDGQWANNAKFSITL